MAAPLTTPYSRLWSIENRAGPANAPAYQGLWRAGALTWSQGDVTLIRIPDPSQYNSFQTVGKITGDKGNPELTIRSRYTLDLSTLLRLARRGCDNDFQLHFGACENPQDFNRGWQKVIIVEGARITNYSTDDLGAFDPGENAVINEEVPVSGEDAYEVKRLLLAEKATTQVVREVMAITICDAQNCGVCGIPSDGCDVVLAAVKSSDSSPGVPAEVVWTKDGGLNWYDLNITSMAATDDPDDILCVGSYTLVVSQDSIGVHYAPTSEITNADDDTATWTKVATGLVAAGAPRKAWSADPSHTWIVGLLGYVYFTADITSGVSVQDAGVATTQQLNDVHGIDNLNVVAVGVANSVIYTANGGSIWKSLTGPSVGSNLNTVWMKSLLEWWVGTSTGRLWYTRDGGVTWAEKIFPGSGAGSVRSIKFASDSVGYMAHSTAAPAGRIFRTIDGGNSWYLIPEDVAQTIPANDYISDIAVCQDVNQIFAGGLADNALDGIIVQGG